jgi:chromosome segregation ATPase
MEISQENDKESIFLKDLQMKIKVLKQGVLEERNKKSDLEKDIAKLKIRIYEYEKKITEQDNIICTLSKEKYELHSKLEIEKTKVDNSSSSTNVGDNIMNLIGGIFQTRKDSSGDSSDKEVKKLQNENLDLEKQIENLHEKLKDQSEDFERCKGEYQNLLALQMERLKKVEVELQGKNIIIQDNAKKLESLYETYKKLDIEKTRYESRLNEYIDSDRLKNEKIIELLTRLVDQETVITAYKENLSRHEEESAGLARKLAELKNAIIEQNMIIQYFKGEKVSHSDDIEGIPVEVDIR